MKRPPRAQPLSAEEENRWARRLIVVSMRRSWRGGVLSFAWQGVDGRAHAFRGSLVSDSEPGVWRWSASVDGEVAREGVSDSKAAAKDAAIDALADIVGEIFWP